MSEFTIRIEGIGDSERVAQLEEIVRCIDCVHAVLGFADGDGSRTTIGCDRFDRPHRRNIAEVDPDGFCAWGVRREDERA